MLGVVVGETGSADGVADGEADGEVMSEPGSGKASVTPIVIVGVASGKS